MTRIEFLVCAWLCLFVPQAIADTPVIRVATDWPTWQADPIGRFAAFRDAWSRSGPRPLDEDVVSLVAHSHCHPFDAEALFWVKAYTPGDESQAHLIDLLRRSAALGFLPARAELGARHVMGSGVPKDQDLGFQLLNETLLAGDANAARLLGELYAANEGGVVMDLVKSESYLTWAVALGMHEAYWNLVLVQKEQLKVEAATATALAGAEAGDPRCMEGVLAAYRTGIFLPQDPEREVHWLKRLAEQEHSISRQAEAQRQLAALYARGGHGGLRRNEAEAVRLLKSSAGKGNDAARLSLANVMLTGEYGEPPDPASALWLLDDLAARNNPRAQMTLGRLYLEGVLVARDEARAMALIDRAAEQGLDEAKIYARRIQEQKAAAAGPNEPS